jgi:DNA-binding CsgD family transcriptional regulator
MEGTVQPPLWLGELTEQVRCELSRLAEAEDHQRPAREEEKRRLEDMAKGWSQSLAKADLSPALRSAIESEWTKALARIQEIENLLAEDHARRRQVDDLLDAEEVMARLKRLPEVLASNNPTLGNLELSLHVDRIDCYADGRVVLRTYKLGALAGAAELIASDSNGRQINVESGNRDAAAHQATPRRRARLRVESEEAAAGDLDAAADMAADPHRFAGLDDSWFWEDEFHVPHQTSWAKANAVDVARLRATGMTTEALAAHFGKSIPTIRASLSFAAELDESLRALPKKMPRRRWHEDHAVKVASLRASGMSTAEIAEQLGKSDVTIRKALDFARQHPQPGAQSADSPDGGASGPAFFVEPNEAVSER